jgi:hypothetical protein
VAVHGCTGRWGIGMRKWEMSSAVHAVRWYCVAAACAIIRRFL